jgi:ubiquinone biosynthesis protein UbiJ
MTPSGEDRLRASIRRLASKSRTSAAGQRPELTDSQPLSLDPTNAFEVAIAEQIRALRDDVDELKDRLNWLFGLIIAAAAANVVLALLG